MSIHALEGLGRLSPRPLASPGSPGRVAVACSIAAGIVAGGGVTSVVLFVGESGLSSPVTVAQWFVLGGAAGFFGGAVLGWACNRGQRVLHPLRHFLLAAFWACLLACAGWVVALWMALTVPLARSGFHSGAVGSAAAWLLGAGLVLWALLEIAGGVRRLHPGGQPPPGSSPQADPTADPPRLRRSR